MLPTPTVDDSAAVDVREEAKDIALFKPLEMVTAELSCPNNQNSKIKISSNSNSN
jgi:hypothetical protein